ncbi:PREDICTED: uncharacterized protein LOC109179441 [Ipomoea nil]|uniref:uncharacterized protein LOC109179441 n=1 Tax=Ipomoea nil TaxID=35883 RepID=UPI000901176B|nr:PREDICTED: uncharacterized protein LOC109179441 [Ipomoea nil]
MAQYRQSGGYSNGGGGGLARNGVASNHVSIAVRSSAHKQQQQSRLLHGHHRRLKSNKISVGGIIVILCLCFVASVLAFVYFTSQNKEFDNSHAQDADIENDTDFLTNVTRIRRQKVHFGHGSVQHGRDSRGWDRDDRTRDDSYSEEELERSLDGSLDKLHSPPKGKNSDKKSSSTESHRGLDYRGKGLYGESGRDELKAYEAEYQASLNNVGQSQQGYNAKNNHPSDSDKGKKSEAVDIDDAYDDGIDLDDTNAEGYDEVGHEDEDHPGAVDRDEIHPFDTHDDGAKNKKSAVEVGKGLTGFSKGELISSTQHSKGHLDARNERHSARRSTSEKRLASRKKSKRRPCEMKLLNSTELLVEPLESRKFARFSLQYTEREHKPVEGENWEPRFAGHQSLEEREESFLAQDQKINCGFVKGPEGAPSTGFDLADDDAKYISTCHIAVVSCIFGNSDRLRMPVGKLVSRFSRKNVCFVMFVDEVTMQTLSSEGQMLDSMGFIGLWKIVVVKNLPYDDMRRVGKIPKFLSHRLFTSARYSIWLDSKLRLQLDPVLILEYFLWRKGHEYAISNHYDRHCVWEEVAQNKKLNKYNHTVIDEQFEFYRADGLERFDASDPEKLLPSNVPEGSFILRAHTPMSNLFSCLWFNEVDRFTPRDQLSFAYTYFKLRRMNPEKPFYLNMFKDCERRKIAKLFHHRSEERRKIISQLETE